MTCVAASQGSRGCAHFEHMRTTSATKDQAVPNLGLESGMATTLKEQCTWSFAGGSLIRVTGTGLFPSEALRCQFKSASKTVVVVATFIPSASASSGEGEASVAKSEMHVSHEQATAQSAATRAESSGSALPPSASERVTDFDSRTGLLKGVESEGYQSVPERIKEGPLPANAKHVSHVKLFDD